MIVPLSSGWYFVYIICMNDVPKIEPQIFHPHRIRHFTLFGFARFNGICPLHKSKKICYTT